MDWSRSRMCTRMCGSNFRDCPTQDNMADCFTKPIIGPTAQRMSDAISGYMETAPIPQRVAFIKSIAIASSESHPSHPIPICRRLKFNSIKTDQVGGVRGDDKLWLVHCLNRIRFNTDITQPCTHGGPRSQNQNGIAAEDTWRGIEIGIGIGIGAPDQIPAAR